MTKTNRRNRNRRRAHDNRTSPRSAGQPPSAPPGAQSPHLGAGLFEREQSDVARALDIRVLRAARKLVSSGWTPADISAAARRTRVGPGVTHLLDVVAAITAEHPALLVHWRWRSELASVGAAQSWASDASPSSSWAGSQPSWSAAAQSLVKMLVIAEMWPRLETVILPPGDPANAREPADASGADAKALHRVRALLRKAEATEFSEEAESLTAKAQQLMTQYSLDQALADGHGGDPLAPRLRRLWLDSPYLTAKSLLVGAVARANNCTTVLFKEFGVVTVVGHDKDLDLVELLSTSLLVQATRAVTTASPTSAGYGDPRIRSYRQSFLVAFARRIDERLRAAVLTEQQAANAASQGALLPVLANRRAAVKAATATWFPAVRHLAVGNSNYDGWGAGRAAADRADVGVRKHVGGG